MSDTAWAAVTTARGAERIAEVALTAIGYQCWLPTYTKRFRGNRLSPDGTHRIRTRIDAFGPRPLFPGYLFVLVPHGDVARDIDRTRGVRALMRHPPEDEYSVGYPKLIRARVMQQLRQVCDAGIWEDRNGFLQFGPPAGRITPGDRVRTAAGIVGIVLALDDRGRALLMADLLGDSRVVRGVEAARLEVVESAF